MVCKDCRVAGNAISVGLTTGALRTLHEACKGSTHCDCQHATESALNQEAIKREHGNSSS